MSPQHSLAILRNVLEAEGWRAARDRLLDRMADARRRARFRLARADFRFEASILHVLATPLSRALGGVQIQFLRRMEARAGDEPFALLYPDAGGYRLEMQPPEGPGRFLPMGSHGTISPTTLEDRSWEDAVRLAAARVRASVIHLEGVASMPAASMLRLAEEGPWRVRLGVHDFSLFCPRPQLVEKPALCFCDYARDEGRCMACLRCDWAVSDGFSSRYREISNRLLRLAESVTYPSDFLRRTFADLFPGLDSASQLVVEPTPPRPVSLPPKKAHAPDEFRVAFVGSFQVHKGARAFLDLARDIHEVDAKRVRWYILGGGDPALLREARGLGNVMVRGYYRAGTLSALLRTLGIDLALLLSAWPETYGITLDECQYAGVEVASTGAGAMGDRLRTLPPKTRLLAGKGAILAS